MKTQNKLRTCAGKQVYKKISQICASCRSKQMSNYGFHCAPISEIPSNISTMPACHKTKIYFLFFLIEQ